MSDTNTLYWIRRDFRLHDNAALSAAIQMGAPILPVYLWEEELEKSYWGSGGASRWWLHRALEEAAVSWRERGGQLIVLSSSDPLVTLRELCQQHDATQVVWNRRYEADLRVLDARVKRGLREAGIGAESYQDALLVEPHTIGTGDGKPYKVYTPFWKTCQNREPKSPIAVPLSQLRLVKTSPKSVSIESLGLLPKHAWHKKMDASWRVGEKAGLEQMRAFLRGGAAHYDEHRDLPGENGTSRMSPYLHWGHVSPRTVAHELKQAQDVTQGGPLVYLKELYWREFAYNVLYHFPHTPTEPLRPEFKDFPWQADETVLKRWQHGQTGYPIVDAGMRELYATGWMHNRVRMVVASFLVKHLLQPWQDGARWFWDTLVDADLASNTLGWQWSAGCGADAAPYFRIFNPLLQSRKFDADGNYLKHWLPELESLHAEYLHAPWEAPGSVLRGAGIRMGKDYPEPIIDHSMARARALKAFDQFKKA
jgi:deoxyribodipyrimidine photo-lyase